jgi:hypothetical protein
MSDYHVITQTEWAEDDGLQLDLGGRSYDHATASLAVHAAVLSHHRNAHLWEVGDGKHYTGLGGMFAAEPPRAQTHEHNPESR